MNDSLLLGPCLLLSLYNILIRLCIRKLITVADINQAFLQICLHEEHRDFVHFLSSKIVVLRFVLAAFGLTSSPFLWNTTIKHHLEKYLFKTN